MSEGRQLALLLVGALVLALVGVVAATVFPEPCEEVEGIGGLELAFAGAGDVLPLDDAEVAALEAVGDELGIGLWGGAVALPPGAALLPSDFGFFAVTDTDLVALRPGSARASAPRDVTGSSVVPVGATSAGIVTEDGTIAVISSDYERERCGELPVDAEVLAIERGFAVLATPSGARLWALEGGERWDVEVPGGVRAATLDGQVVQLVSPTGISTTLLTDPAVVDELPLEDPATLATVGDRLLLVEPTAPATLVDVAARELTPGAPAPVGDVLRVDDLAASAPIVDAAPTPAGIVLTTGATLATDRGTTAPLPDGVTATEVVVSEDGQVGVVVEADGADGPVLLVWGRDLAPLPEDG